MPWSANSFTRRIYRHGPLIKFDLNSLLSSPSQSHLIQVFLLSWTKKCLCSPSKLVVRVRVTGRRCTSSGKWSGDTRLSCADRAEDRYSTTNKQRTEVSQHCDHRRRTDRCSSLACDNQRSVDIHSIHSLCTSIRSETLSFGEEEQLTFDEHEFRGDKTHKRDLFIKLFSNSFMASKKPTAVILPSLKAFASSITSKPASSWVI